MVLRSSVMIISAMKNVRWNLSEDRSLEDSLYFLQLYLDMCFPNEVIIRKLHGFTFPQHRRLRRDKKRLCMKKDSILARRLKCLISHEIKQAEINISSKMFII